MGNCSECISMKVKSHVNFEEEGIVFTKSSNRAYRTGKIKMNEIFYEDLASRRNHLKIKLIQRTYRKFLIKQYISNPDKAKNYISTNKSFDVINYYSTNKPEGNNYPENNIDNGVESDNLNKKEFTYIRYQSNTELMLKEYESNSKIDYERNIWTNIEEAKEVICEKTCTNPFKHDDIKRIKKSNGSTYLGHSDSDKAEGFGILIHADEDIYCGYWKADEANGVGKYTNLKGSNYQGFWMDNKRNGYGREKSPSGGYYEGYFLDGQKHSVGILKFEDGTYYEGEFSNNEMNGIGIFYFKDARIYYGQWRNNKMNGYGIITWSDGKRFEGFFEEDKKEGFGIFYANSKIYLANWKSSKLDGDVVIIQNNAITKSLWNMGKKVTTFPDDYYIPFEGIAEQILN